MNFRLLEAMEAKFERLWDRCGAAVVALAEVLARPPRRKDSERDSAEVGPPPTTLPPPPPLLPPLPPRYAPPLASLGPFWPLLLSPFLFSLTHTNFLCFIF